MTQVANEELSLCAGGRWMEVGVQSSPGKQGGSSTLSVGDTFTLHPTPYTLHPTPHTAHPTPYTLHPTPYTLNLSPYTLHPTPYTLHPAPRTLQRTLSTGDYFGVQSSPSSPGLQTKVDPAPCTENQLLGKGENRELAQP